jgi:2-polyprenyl-3-methyl-5-hydroxy-6-metoxy-1,4-benzoquinol methylase
VVDGIPRFVALPDHKGLAQIQGAFDFEHRRYERSQFTQFQPKLLDMFLGELGPDLPADWFAGKRAADVGCGSGRWSYALVQLGADVTGVDLTAGGVEAAQHNLAENANVRFAQADIFALPLPEETYDFVMSWGVLHHTPSTRNAFGSVSKLVKPGGVLFVMIYEKHDPLLFAGTNVLRFFLRRLDAQKRWEFCRRLVIDTKSRTKWAVRLRLNKVLMLAFRDPDNPTYDVETYQFGLYDAYSPRYNFLHTADEVRSWFEEEGFIDVRVLDRPRGSLYVTGVRPLNPSSS